MAELKKTLGFWMVAAIAFLNLINTGIFFGIQLGAKEAGIDSLIAWGILAVLSVYIAMCFSELIAMFPSAGGVYEFAKQAYGRFTSFLIGWIVWVSGNIATALFTVAAIDYIVPNTPLIIGTFYLSAFSTKLTICIAIIILLNYVAYRGIEASARLMILLSIFMLGIVAIIIFPGLAASNTTYFTGFTLNMSIILIAAFFLSETFFGWESVSFMSEETKDAERTIPRALIFTTALVALIALLVAIATTGVLSIPGILGTDKPIVAMLQHLFFSPELILVVNIGIVVTLLGNASGNIISLPRLLLALSRDKLFIEQFSDIHPRHQTPYKAIIFQTIIGITIVLIAAGTYKKLLELLVPISLLMYATIIILVSYFRFTRPDHPRPFKVWFGSWLPIFISGLYILLLAYWAISEPNAIGQLRLLFSFIFFSVPIYLLLTYFYDPDSLISTINFFSRINLWLENVFIPRRLRHEISEFFSNIKDKHILEFGSGVGTLTVHLASQVGSNGKVYAVELSQRNVEIIKRRMNKLGHTHVEVIHDPHLVNRVHPSVKSADIIVSINNLSYIQDIGKVLREMNSILPPRGKIYFIEYVDLFYFLPNPKWLSDPEGVKNIFSQAGFTVTVRVRQGLFWKYLYIYGIKEHKDAIYI